MCDEHELYLYYHCDAHKSTHSFVLAGLFDGDRLREEIWKDKQKGYIKLPNRTEEDVQGMKWCRLNSHMEYGYIAPVDVNVRLDENEGESDDE